ncbi:MAG: efflux RND transporter periplasmic adaptor subunit [Anaerolineales bacterium]|nr:efflux RND transporter periplasmic adaptor subunit [Anaerolineales bacterium]MBX3035864.1 efflux RND transporter periplasmic adaptor subunit [Anaerolineales bacterium]
MKKIFGLTIFLIASLLNVMPVSATQAVTLTSSDSVIASAKVIPAQISKLSFLISALVKEIEVKEGDIVQAGDVLITLNTPDLEYAVIAAQEDYNARALAAELQKAERVKYVNPNTGYVRWYPIPREVYLKALSKAEQSFAVWESAQATLNQNTLLAPFNGSVVSIDVAVGELVQINQVVLTLATLDNLQIVTTDLSERGITRVKIGQSVNVYIEALDITVTGKVIRISPIAETSGGDVVFPVTIQLDEQPQGLLWGMSAEVEIATK